MKRFRFRLERVLKVRERIRDDARQELVHRNGERDRELSLLEHLEAEYRRITVKEGGTYSAGELVLLGAYHERLKKEIDRQREVVAAAIASAEKARELYLVATRNAKVLEMLQEKRRQEHNDLALKEEARELDELAIQRFGRTE